MCITTILRYVHGKERSAVIGDALIPLQLIEALHRKAVGKPLRHVKHVDRNQCFLDFGARAPERCGIERVD